MVIENGNFLAITINFVSHKFLSIQHHILSTYLNGARLCVKNEYVLNTYFFLFRGLSFSFSFLLLFSVIKYKDLYSI